MNKTAPRHRASGPGHSPKRDALNNLFNQYGTQISYEKAKGHLARKQIEVSEEYFRITLNEFKRKQQENKVDTTANNGAMPQVEPVIDSPKERVEVLDSPKERVEPTDSVKERIGARVVAEALGANPIPVATVNPRDLPVPPPARQDMVPLSEACPHLKPVAPTPTADLVKKAKTVAKLTKELAAEIGMTDALKLIEVLSE